MKKTLFLLKLLLLLTTMLVTLACDEEEKEEFNAPSGLTAVINANNGIDLSWKDNADNETGFIVERADNNGSFATIIIVTQNTSSYSDSSVQENTPYEYRVKAIKNAEETGYSNTVSITIETIVPEAPSGLNAAATSDTTIHMSWTDGSDNETSFEIARQSGSAEFEVIATLAANETTYDDTSLSADTTYTYRVRAVNPYGESDWSNEATATTLDNSGDLKFIADHTVAKDSVLRSIPTQYIEYARNNFHIAYQHTSHGTHVSRGMFGLPDFKAGDNELFGITRNSSPVADKLNFQDSTMSSYAAPGVDAADLSRNETAFIQATRNYLDDENNHHINIVMWAWCNIAGHDVAGNYLPGMQTLISEYGPGGSKIGTGEGQRETPVTFIFMTGHGNTDNNVGDRRPKNQAELINNLCIANNYFCLDYWGIDSHDMNDNYYEDAGDNGNSNNYGGNFYQDYQDTHTLGTHWYNNKSTPGGNNQYGAHNSQHITANRKAFAMWWILARIAGWDGISSN